MKPAFTHFMSVNSPIFNNTFIRLINEEFNPEEHMFILGNRDIYASLTAQYDNVAFEAFFNLTTVDKYDNGINFLIIHGMFLTSSEICRMDNNMIKRIVWCIWGHDLYYVDKNISANIKSNFITKYEKWLSNKKMSKVRAIVAGFKYDAFEIRRRFGKKVSIYNALYSSGYYKDDVDNILKIKRSENNATNILIGHSAFPFLQHDKILKQLARYKNEDIILTLVLAYGDDKYADMVIKSASDIFSFDKLNIIRHFMNWKEYIALLCSVDIAIFDFDHQAAFGNLILLSYMGKKLYLSPSGVMYRAFSAEKAEVYSCSDIGRIPFSEFKTIMRVNTNNLYAESLLDKQNIIEQWKELFKALN